MIDANTARSCTADPPVVTTVVTTVDALVVSPVGASKALTSDHAIEDRSLDLQALFERSWARNEAGYRRLAER